MAFGAASTGAYSTSLLILRVMTRYPMIFSKRPTSQAMQSDER